MPSGHPSSEDEEEKVCLLFAAADESEGSCSPTGPVAGGTKAKAASSSSSGAAAARQISKEDELFQGESEKTFFTVCQNKKSAAAAKSNNNGNNNIPAEEASDDDDSIEASIATVKGLLSDIEEDGITGGGSKKKKKCVKGAAQSKADPNKDDDDDDVEDDGCPCSAASGSNPSPGFAASKTAVGNKTSGSLVVDVHLPPEVEQQKQHQQPQQPQQQHQSSTKPCKHSVSRFQRCYSDSSHQGSPKRSAGGKGTSKIGMLPSASTSKVGNIVSSHNNNGNNGRDFLQNLDKIETICETSCDLQTAASASVPAAVATGLKDRFRHCSESFVQRLHRSGGGNNANNSEEENKRKSDIPGGAPSSSLLLHQLPTFVANDNVRLDIFATPSSNNNNSGGGRNNNNDDDDDFDEEDMTEQSDLLNRSGLAGAASEHGASAVVVPGGSEAAAAPSSYHQLNQKLAMLSQSNSSINTFGHGYPDYPHHAGSPYKAKLSTSSSTVSMPACRICQLPAMEPNNSLISPCRCLGSIRYVHNNCLLKWLEVSSRRRSGPPCCELCQYQYLRHKKFVISHWRFPECSLKDKILHLFFVFCVFVMIACAAVTIICFKEVSHSHHHSQLHQGHQQTAVGHQQQQEMRMKEKLDRWPYRHHSSGKYQPGELSPPELISLSSAILFFSAFFLAMYVELKAKHTVYQLVCKFFYMNHEWSVEEYDRKRDLRRKEEAEEDDHEGEHG